MDLTIFSGGTEENTQTHAQTIRKCTTAIQFSTIRAYMSVRISIHFRCMLFVALGWSLLEAIRIDWAHHEKLPPLRIYNQHIHQKCTFTPLGATVPIVKKKKKKRFEQIFHSWKDIVHWNDRLRRNCWKLEDLGMLSGALPVHEGRFFYFLRTVKYNI